MARIPMGDFGQVVARPVQQGQADPNAYGAGVGRALDQAGQVGMNIAGQEIAQANAQANAEERQRQAEERQRMREAAAEAKAAAREATRVKSLTAQATVANGLLDLHDEIDKGLADGTVDKTKAAELYASRSAKLVEDGTKDVDPEHQGIVRANLMNDIGRGRSAVLKLVNAREKADIKAGGLSYIEEMQRFAARGGKEADQAIANVKEFWTATGPMAGEDPAQAQLRVQAFAERVRFTQATALVNADPGAALKALKDPKYLPELDPGQRTNLIHTADARVLQQQQRAEINARARERALEQEWKGFSAITEAGKLPTPEETARLDKMFRGTPLHAAFKQLVSQAPASAAFAAQPVMQQAAALDEMQAKMNAGGATAGMLDQYKAAEKTHKATLADIKADPYAAAAERGVIRQIAPLSLDLAQLPQQLALRARDAAVVGQWAGGDVSLFRPQEAAKVGEILAALPAKDRAGAFSGLAKAMTPGQMRAFAQQLGAKDDTLAAAAILSAQGAKTTAGRLTSEILLAGADAIKEQRIKWPSGQDQTAVRAEIDKLTRGAYLSEDANRAAGDAALAVFAGLVAEGKTPTVKTAVDMATGGIMEHGGQKLIKPYGWSDGMVSKALRDVDAARVGELTGGQPARWGDKQLQPDELARLMPGAQLGPSKQPGAYTISIGGRMVMGPTGRPLLLPLEKR